MAKPSFSPAPSRWFWSVAMIRRALARKYRRNSSGGPQLQGQAVDIIGAVEYFNFSRS